MALSRLGNLQLKKTVFFLCDMQEKFRPAITYFRDIVEVAKRMVDASRILKIPLVVTEQYLNGLGHTVPELDIGHAACKAEKTKFSMVIPEVVDRMKFLCDGDVCHVVLFGVETHVCVQQTVIDLLLLGYEVHVVADACSSRSQIDRLIAFEALGELTRDEDKRWVGRFAREYLRHDGVFALRVVAHNSSTIIIQDLVLYLWRIYRGKEHLHNSQAHDGHGDGHRAEVVV